MSAATRAYLPLERAHTADLHAGGAVRAGAIAFCVTDAMRSSHPGSDEEELEFRALQQAARHAIAQGRPVIIAALDLTDSGLEPAGDLTSVTTVAVTTREVVSLHLSDEALAGSVTSDTQDPAGSSRSAAIEEVDRISGEELPAVELSWFDITELSHVLRYTQ